MRKAILVAVLVVPGLLIAGLALSLGSEEEGVQDVAPITAYFNKGGDDLRAAIEQAISEHPGQVDIAMYSFTDLLYWPTPPLAHFLKDLPQTRSIRILLSSESVSEREERVCQMLDPLPNIEMFYRSNMHHKFVVIGDEAVITGSANWSQNSLDDEANNIVVIESGEIALAYEDEFTHLLSGATPGCHD